MGGLNPAPTAPTAGARALSGRERWSALASLALLVALAWLYLWREASLMPGMSIGMGGAPMPRSGIAVELALTFVMWSVMMVGMMLPSAAPATLLYAKMARHRQHGLLSSTWLFVAGYLSAWTLYSAVVAALQVWLASLGLLGDDMAFASARLSGAILVGAGIYQWLPLKNVCLAKCRNPLSVFLMHWQSGPLGAWRMGFAHGTHCVGCCWALMLVLFVAGVMNLLWVAVIAAFVLFEKLVPQRKLASYLSGAGLVILGLAIATLS